MGMGTAGDTQGLPVPFTSCEGMSCEVMVAMCLSQFWVMVATHQTRVMGMGFLGGYKFKPIPVPVGTRDLNP